MNTLAAKNYRARALDLVSGICLFVGLSLYLAPYITDQLYNGDELDVLVHAYSFSTLEILFDPENYQTLSTSNFTPGATLSFKIDAWMFGNNFKAFWIHQCLAIALTLTLIFVLARQLEVSLLLAISAVFFVLPTPVVNEWLSGLQLRHYIEGMAFALAAMIIQISAWRETRRHGKNCHSSTAKSLLSAICVLIACLYKEIYAVTPALMLVIAFTYYGPKSNRASYLLAVPPAVAVVLYLIWRHFMLGGFGGYSTELTNFSNNSDFAISEISPTIWRELQQRLHTVISAVAGNPEVIFGKPWVALGIVTITALASIWHVYRREFTPLSLTMTTLGFSTFILLTLAPAIADFGIPPRWITLVPFAASVYLAWLASKIGGFGAITGFIFLFIGGLHMLVSADNGGREWLGGPATRAAYFFAIKSDPNDLLYIPSENWLIVRQTSSIAKKAEVLQGRPGGVASTGPLVNYLLDFYGKECFTIGGPNAYKKSKTENCFDYQGNIGFEPDMPRYHEIWQDTLKNIRMDEKSNIYYFDVTAKNVHIVISDEQFYVHQVMNEGSASIEPAILRRSGVRPDRALITVALEDQDGYRVSDTLSLRKIPNLHEKDL